MAPKGEFLVSEATERHSNLLLIVILVSAAVMHAVPQVREYLGEAYIIQGKIDLAKDQLATIEELCGKECEYYEDLADAIRQAHGA